MSRLARAKALAWLGRAMAYQARAAAALTRGVRALALALGEHATMRARLLMEDYHLGHSQTDRPKGQ